MGRALATGLGILCLTVLSVGTTELSLAHASQRTSPEATHLVSRPKPSATPTPTPTPTATPAPTPTPTPTLPTVTTNSFVHLRARPTTASTDLADLQGGTVLILGTYSDPSWQEVIYNGIDGYVYKTYLTY